MIITRADIERYGPWEHCIQLSEDLYTIPQENWDEHLGALTYQHFIGRTLPGLLKRLCHKCPEKTSVVDLGCMDGWLSLLLRKEGFKPVYGIDINGDKIKQANFLKDLLSIGSLQFVQMDLQKEHLNETFDVGIMLGLFNHLNRPIEVLEKLHCCIQNFLVMDLNIFVHRQNSELANQNSYLDDQSLQGNISVNFERGGPFRHGNDHSLVMQYDQDSVIMLMQACGFHSIMEMPMPLATPSWMVPIRKLFVAYRHENPRYFLDDLNLREAYRGNPKDFFLKSDMFFFENENNHGRK